MTRRLLLWDVDGALLVGGGVGVGVFAVAFTAVTGRPWAGRLMTAGRTDLSVAAVSSAISTPPSAANGDDHPVRAELVGRARRHGARRGRRPRRGRRRGRSGDGPATEAELAAAGAHHVLPDLGDVPRSVALRSP